MKKIVILFALVFALSFVGCAPPHEHTYSETWSFSETEHWHAAICGHTSERADAEAHRFGEDGSCEVCGFRPTEAPHEHTFSEAWESSETEHWHAATCGHNVVSGRAAHTFEGNSCKVCGYEIPDDREETDLKTLCERMSSAYYSENLKCTRENGLSDASVVGANEAAMSEVRYPVPADGEFKHVYNVSEREILPSVKDNSAALNSLIRSLAEVDGLKKIVFPEGVYRFAQTVSLNGISDLYLVGEGTTEFLMTQWTEALDIRNCENLHINNIDFDYETSSTVTGTVHSSDPEKRTVTIDVNEPFDLSDYRYTGGKIDKGNYMEFLRDERTGDYYPDEKGMLLYNSNGDRISMISDGVWDPATRRLTLTFGSNVSFRAPEKGKAVSVGYTMYEHFTVWMHDSKNFYMESCNIYSSVGMTFGFYSTENIYMNRTNLMLREGSNKLMTATADGLHTNDCLGDLIVSNSIYENSHDDALNVCTFYKTITGTTTSRDGTYVIICQSASMETDFPTNVGDEIEIYDSAMRSVGKYNVLAVKTAGLVSELTVDKPVRRLEKGQRVGNLTRTPKLTLENCVIRNKRNRGILCQTQHSVIRNCTFYNVIHGAIQILSSYDIFNEGLIPRDIAVENCKFVNDHSSVTADVAVFRSGGEIVPDTITGVSVKNCFFASSAIGAGVQFAGTGDCEMSHNLFYNRAEGGNFYLAAISNSARVSVLDNYVYFLNPRENYSMYAESGSEDIEKRNNEAANAAFVK